MMLLHMWKLASRRCSETNKQIKVAVLVVYTVGERTGHCCHVEGVGQLTCEHHGLVDLGHDRLRVPLNHVGLVEPLLQQRSACLSLLSVLL